MARDRNDKLKDWLEELYGRFNRRKYVDSDPLVFLYEYPDKADREIVGLIASSLAFGNVKQILASVEKVLAVLGPSPRDYLLSADAASFGKQLGPFKHRWIDSGQIHQLLRSISETLMKFGSLEECFDSAMDGSGGDIHSALKIFVDELDGGVLRKGFLPCPERGSPCKRLYLYLRWMIRSDEVDPGGWKCASPSQLTVPLDTHMYRLAGKLGFTGRNQSDMKTAIEITDAFRALSPEDPVKYDFTLTRLGIINSPQMQEAEEELEEKLFQLAGGV